MMTVASSDQFWVSCYDKEEKDNDGVDGGGGGGGGGSDNNNDDDDGFMDDDANFDNDYAD